MSKLQQNSLLNFFVFIALKNQSETPLDGEIYRQRFILNYSDVD